MYLFCISCKQIFATIKVPTLVPGVASPGVLCVRRTPYINSPPIYAYKRIALASCFLLYVQQCYRLTSQFALLDFRLDFRSATHTVGGETAVRDKGRLQS